MEKIIKQGRLLFGIAIAGLGVENMICARCAETAISSAPHSPVLPWVPAHPWLAYLTGIALVAAGFGILANRKSRLAAILLGTLLFLFVLILEAPRVAARPLGLSVRTCAFETLALCGAAFMLAGALPADGSYFQRWDGALDKLGRFLFAASLVVFGTTHFLVLGVIAGLVPSWIPWHLFWAYLTGAAFIAAGLSIATKWMGRLGAALIGTMFLLWFFLLHAPRTLGLYAVGGGPHNPNEWSSAFIALGMWGGSWICAWALSTEGSQKQ